MFAPMLLAALAPLTIQTVTVPSQQSTESQVVRVAGAPAGTSSATFRLSGSFLVVHTVENLTPAPNPGLTTGASCHLELSLLGHVLETADAAATLFYPTFPAFDGVLDLRGRSAASAVTLVSFDLPATVITDPRVLDLLTGTPRVLLDLRATYLGVMTHFGSAICDWGGPGPDVLGLSLTVTYQ